MTQKSFPIFPNLLKSVSGPQQKWVIDALGNILLSGRLQVEGWVDPTWLQLDNQMSSTGIPPNSIYTLDDALTFKNSGGTVKTIAADVATVRCRANSSDTNVVVGSTATAIISESISPASSSNSILVIAGYQGTNSSGSLGSTPTIQLIRVSPSSTLATITEDTEGSGTGTRTWGGVIIGIDAPATTSTRTYRLQMSETLSGTWTVVGSSIALIEVTLT